ncbi:MAG: class I SAM-dependent methyltransferase [Bryobacteraceae bacterium]
MKILLGLFALVPLSAQVAVEANKSYQSADSRKRMAVTLTGEHRDARQKPKELIAALGIEKGMRVADIGTGPGYLLPFLCQAVTGSGAVYAEDIFPDFLAAAKERADCGHAHFLLGDERSPKLEANSIDLALVLDAYHHFDYPESMLAGIHKALRGKGRLAIVDYYKRRGAMSNTNPDFAIGHVRLDDAGVVKEVEANGFTLVSNKAFLPGSQYIAIFEKK